MYARQLRIVVRYESNSQVSVKKAALSQSSSLTISCSCFTALASYSHRVVRKVARTIAILNIDLVLQKTLGARVKIAEALTNTATALPFPTQVCAGFRGADIIDLCTVLSRSNQPRSGM